MTEKEVILELVFENLVSVLCSACGSAQHHPVVLCSISRSPLPMTILSSSTPGASPRHSDPVNGSSSPLTVPEPPSSSGSGAVSVPDWVMTQRGAWGEKLSVPEWEDDEGNTPGHRAANGWLGSDLVHSETSPVRVLEYMVQYGNGDVNIDKSFERGGVGTTLTGLVYFSSAAESHMGYCHGGSMCSIMDDVIGWTGFVTTGRCLPWSGFTAQVNTSMKKPVPVDSFLIVKATIVKMERRKVYIEAKLMDGEGKRDEDVVVHATAEGLVVLKRGTFPWESEEK